MHSWPIGIENPNHPDIDPVLPIIIEKKGLGAAFTLIITRPDPYGINITPVIFLLWMNSGITINFACRSLEDLGFYPFCQPEHVDGTHDTGLNSFDRIVLIMNG